LLVLTLFGMLCIALVHAHLCVYVLNERIADLSRVNGMQTAQVKRLLEHNNMTLNDTSKMNVLAFMCFLDDTNRHDYIEGEYVCRHFAWDMIANATLFGMRCGYVAVYFDDGTSHALVSFNTTRDGIVFADPQHDCFVNIEQGLEYSDGDYITDYEIIWNDDFS